VGRQRDRLHDVSLFRVQRYPSRREGIHSRRGHSNAVNVWQESGEDKLAVTARLNRLRRRAGIRCKRHDRTLHDIPIGIEHCAADRSGPHLLCVIRRLGIDILGCLRPRCVWKRHIFADQTDSFLRERADWGGKSE